MKTKYAKDLCALIACETVNTHDADTPAKFMKIEAALQNAFPRAFSALEKIDTKDNLLLRWKGLDPLKPAVALLAHLDVVPATGAWSVPPFEGVIRDGCVYGRGAMDTKNSLCAMYEAVEALLEKGFAPPCDIYLSSSHNEETFGDGAVHARDYFSEHHIPLALVLDEGGAVVENPMPGLKGHFAMIGVVEKGYANIRFIARGKGGHASAPPRHSPVARLAAFVTHMEKHPPFAVRFPQVVCDMFQAFAPHMAQPYRFLFSHLALCGWVIRKVIPSVSPQAAAMLQTTCAFTMTEGSQAANVIPETASVTANLRFIAHQPMTASIEAVRREASKFDLETEVLYASDVSAETRRDSTIYAYVKSIVNAVFTDAPAAPYLMVGGTDSRHFSTVCPNVIRFSPAILSPSQMSSMHGIDENVSIDSLALSVAFYEKLIEGLGKGFPFPCS
jgi:carboxypeptidase PM20D1